MPHLPGPINFEVRKEKEEIPPTSFPTVAQERLSWHKIDRCSYYVFLCATSYSFTKCDQLETLQQPQLHCAKNTPGQCHI